MREIDAFLQAVRRINEAPHGALALHAPVFAGRERDYVLDAIDSTFVSSVGAYVTRFEDSLRAVTGAEHVVACVNGTAALHLALHVCGVRPGQVVLTQALSFVATANAIAHAGAEPVFLDVEADTLGLSPAAVQRFLESHARRGPEGCTLKASGKSIAACVPMHTFGLPCRVAELAALCADWGIALVEDAAEALGSLGPAGHCGMQGRVGVLSFNGNKIVTTGGGGALLTSHAQLGQAARHLSTTAKIPHPARFRHDAVAWNYRMPNLNAALGCAQLERLDHFVADKRRRAAAYARLFAGTDWRFVEELPGCRSNYWLCAVVAPSADRAQALLAAGSAQDIQMRPAWDALHTLPMYAHCQRDDLSTTQDLAQRLVCLPSGVRERQA